jgi:hypothetical protein
MLWGALDRHSRPKRLKVCVPFPDALIFFFIVFKSRLFIDLFYFLGVAPAHKGVAGCLRDRARTIRFLDYFLASP